MIDKRLRDKFLEELSKLSRKHGITVEGCGCCGSPFLEEKDTVGGEYTITGMDDGLEWINNENTNA